MKKYSLIITATLLIILAFFTGLSYRAPCHTRPTCPVCGSEIEVPSASHLRNVGHHHYYWCDSCKQNVFYKNIKWK